MEGIFKRNNIAMNFHYISSLKLFGIFFYINFVAFLGHPS